MNLQEELRHHTSAKNTVVTIGVFDGVHLGHTHLLLGLKEEARRQDAIPCVVTFVNHPRSVLQPTMPVRFITPLEQRLALLKRAGIDNVVALTFDQSLSQLSARDFVQALKSNLHMKTLVVGPNFALGHRREGNVKVLAGLGGEIGFRVEVVEPLMLAGQMVSSTVIREAISRGDVRRAGRMLGRYFSLTGEVVKGEGRGKDLGFPTANLKTDPELLLPADGVYAAWAHVGGKRLMSATSVGVRPTFGENARTVEAYIMNFQSEIYGKQVRLDFCQRLRDELRFDTVEALQQQMELDVEQTRRIFASLETAS